MKALHLILALSWGSAALGSSFQCYKKLTEVITAASFDDGKVEWYYSARAEKDYAKIDRSKQNVLKKVTEWTQSVTKQGLEETRKVSGFHDEPLHGPRKSQRSVRLNEQYRLIYEVVERKGQKSLVKILEITPHKY